MTHDGPVPTRRPLSASEIARHQGERGIPVVALESVTSTNDVALEMFDGRWLAVTADEQVQGRGRLDRRWSSPAAAGVAVSIAVPLADLACPVPELPMRFAVAVVRALSDVGVPAGLKWPNDVMVDDRKVGGMLIALHPGAAVLGVGINTHLEPDELPTELSSSLSMHGFDVPREALIAAITVQVSTALTDPAPVVGEYRGVCTTLGREVSVTLTAGGGIQGTATMIREDGAIVITTQDGDVPVSVGDVVHVRPVRE